MSRLHNTYLSLGISLLLATNAGAWTIHETYDNQAVGEKCASFDDTQSRVIDFQGHRVCENSITAGDTAFGRWGGSVKHPSPLVQGDELWISLNAFFPVGFNYDSTSGGKRLKFIRVRTKDPRCDDKGCGHNDLYINPSTYTKVHFRFIYEGEQLWKDVGGPGDGIQLGMWETYTFYLKFDNVPVSKGGLAQVKVWKNDTLIADITDRKTLRYPEATASETRIFTYWNGGAPKTQSMYIDDLRISSDGRTKPPTAIVERGRRIDCDAPQDKWYGGYKASNKKPVAWWTQRCLDDFGDCDCRAR